MTEEDFQTAKAEMDFLLRACRSEIEGENILGVKVPLNFPSLIARGKNALIFKLPRSHLIAKSSFYDTISEERDPNHKGYYMLAGYVSGLRWDGLEKTIESLREMGFDKREGLFIQDMEQHDCKVNMWHHKKVHYTLMPDLAEDGKYQLQEAENFDFESFSFGGDLRRLYDESYSEILDACKSGSYKLTCAGHGSEEDPEPAVTHMFLVQHNGKQGKLVISDLDHLIIERE